MSFEINPATGLSMIDGISGIDVGGSPYGIDLHASSFSDFGGSTYGTDLYESHLMDTFSSTVDDTWLLSDDSLNPGLFQESCLDVYIYEDDISFECQSEPEETWMDDDSCLSSDSDDNG